MRADVSVGEQATNYMGTHQAGLATRNNMYHLDREGGLQGRCQAPHPPT